MFIISYNVLGNQINNWVDVKRRIIFRNKLIPEIVEKQSKFKYYQIVNKHIADLISRVTVRRTLMNKYGIY